VYTSPRISMVVGAASTDFFINPAEELIVVFLAQLLPGTTYPIARELRATVYSAIVDPHLDLTFTRGGVDGPCGQRS
jgi:hypothetical protein